VVEVAGSHFVVVCLGVWGALDEVSEDLYAGFLRLLDLQKGDLLRSREIDSNGWLDGYLRVYLRIPFICLNCCLCVLVDRKKMGAQQ